MKSIYLAHSPDEQSCSLWCIYQLILCSVYAKSTSVLEKVPMKNLPMGRHYCVEFSGDIQHKCSFIQFKVA